MAIGPALTGVYLENRESINELPGSYPSPASYNLVYLTSGLLSAVSLVFVLMLKKRVTNKIIEI